MSPRPPKGRRHVVPRYSVISRVYISVSIDLLLQQNSICLPIIILGRWQRRLHWRHDAFYAISNMIKNKNMCGADGRHDMQPSCNSQSAYCIYPFGFLELIHMLTSWSWLLASKMALQLSRSIKNLCAEFDLPFMNYAPKRHVQCTDGRQYVYRVAFTFDLLA